MKDANPKLRIPFVGPPVTIEPEVALRSSAVVRRECDRQVVEYASGESLNEVAGVSFRNEGTIVHNPQGQAIENLDKAPVRDLDVARYNVPFLRYPYISLYACRSCPAMCTFCLWPQTHSGHRWRLRSADTLGAFPDVKDIFFDDDTFNYQKSPDDAALREGQTAELHLVRVTTDYETLRAMKEAGCRLFIVGYESGDPQILKNVKKGATIDMALRFTNDHKRLGLAIHGDFIIGLPGETPDTIQRTIDFVKRLDTETIEVSTAHALPGTITYPTLGQAELVEAVERFYAEYYFRPRVVWRVVRKAVFNSVDRRELFLFQGFFSSQEHFRESFVGSTREIKQSRGFPALYS